MGAYGISIFTGIMTPGDLTYGLQYEFSQWYIWCSIIKSFFFAFIITSVASFYGYTVEGGSIEVGKASTDAVVSCSALILFADMILTQLLMQ
jgi:phospholipid/cholesterol/gamma-HCH transport system permease protein